MKFKVGDLVEWRATPEWCSTGDVSVQGPRGIVCDVRIDSVYVYWFQSGTRRDHLSDHLNLVHR